MAQRTPNIFDEVPELAVTLAGLPASSERAYTEAFERLAADDPTGAAILAHGFLLAAERGLKSVTLAALCARARIGRATLYRRWESVSAFKAELIKLTVETSPPGRTTGSLSADLETWTEGALPWLRHPDARAMTLNLIFAIASGTLEGEALVEATASVRTAGSPLVWAAIERGEIDAASDVDLLTAALLGPSILTLLIERREPLAEELAFFNAFFLRLASQRGVPNADWSGVDRGIDQLIHPLEAELDRLAATDSAHAAVLRAAMQLLLFDDITMLTSDLLAVRAGVSKTTIYDRWDNAEAVVTEFAILMMLTAQRPPAATTPFEEMQHWLGRVPVWTASAPIVRAVAAMFHQIVADETYSDELELGRSLWRTMVSDVVGRAVERGQADPRVDPAKLVAALIGPMVQLMMCGQAITEDRVSRLVGAAVAMLSGD